MLKCCFLTVALLSSACAVTKLYEYTCFGYSVVDEHEKITQISCNKSEVFDPLLEKCVIPSAGHWPCSDVKDCSTLKNQRYVDENTKDPTQKCKTYYTCQHGIFFGHNYCPGDTVFNEEMQYCDWVVNVKPPCGTFQNVVGL